MKIDYRLYSVETNLEPGSETISVDELPDRIIEAFGLADCITLKKLTKGNTSSVIYRYTTQESEYILRQAYQEYGDLLAAQANAVAQLKQSLFVHLLKNTNDTYVYDKDGCWICYERAPGVQFDGEPGQLSAILTKAMQLTQGLESAYRNMDNQAFPKVAYNPEEWSMIFRWLNDSSKDELQNRLQQAVPANLRECFLENERHLLLRLDSVKGINLDYTLVHYDLQHANIIVDKDELVFIDLEDIYLSDRLLALSHGIFKWARHCIYVNCDHRANVLEWLNHQCIKSVTDYFDIKITLEKIGTYALFRTFADVYNIMMNVVVLKNTGYLYDLEKKLSNLLEINDLFFNASIGGTQ